MQRASNMAPVLAEMVAQKHANVKEAAFLVIKSVSGAHSLCMFALETCPTRLLLNAFQSSDARRRAMMPLSVVVVARISLASDGEEGGSCGPTSYCSRWRYDV